MPRSILLIYGCLFLLIACDKKDEPALPTDNVDQFTNTNWVRYGFKSPVNGKDTYYYLTFKPNNKVDSYVRLNKTEAPTSLSTGDYVYSYNNTTGVNGFTFTINSTVSTGRLTSAGLELTNAAGTVTYTKE